MILANRACVAVTAQLTQAKNKQSGGLFRLDRDLAEQQDLSKSEPQRLAIMKAVTADWQAEMQRSDTKQPAPNEREP